MNCIVNTVAGFYHEKKKFSFDTVQLSAIVGSHKSASAN